LNFFSYTGHYVTESDYINLVALLGLTCLSSSLHPISLIASCMTVNAPSEFEQIKWQIVRMEVLEATSQGNDSFVFALVSRIIQIQSQIDKRRSNKLWPDD